MILPAYTSGCFYMVMQLIITEKNQNKVSLCTVIIKIVPVSNLLNTETKLKKWLHFLRTLFFLQNKKRTWQCSSDVFVALELEMIKHLEEVSDDL